jgi:hypothetical protein
MHTIAVLAAERPGVRASMFANYRGKRDYTLAKEVLRCRATTVGGTPCQGNALSIVELRRRNSFGAKIPFGFCHVHAITIDRFNRAQRGERRLFEAPVWREYWPGARQCVARVKNPPRRGLRCLKMACTGTTVCEAHGGMGIKRRAEMKQAGEQLPKRTPEERARIQWQKRRQARERVADRRSRIEAGNAARQQSLQVEPPAPQQSLYDQFRGDRREPSEQAPPLYPGTGSRWRY